ncbi:MAG TPA: type II toxin-antitoxin system RelE/ParE family toxin [Verrucomicrobiae bacterium]
MKELILLWQADSDIQAAFNRYQEYQAGRGEVFIRHLDLAFELLRQNPEIGPVYEGPYRRLLLHDFPYGIFYQVQPTRIIIAAVADLRQDPQMIRKKLSGLE